MRQINLYIRICAVFTCTACHTMVQTDDTAYIFVSKYKARLILLSLGTAAHNSTVIIVSHDATHITAVQLTLNTCPCVCEILYDHYMVPVFSRLCSLASGYTCHISLTGYETLIICINRLKLLKNSCVYTAEGTYAVSSFNLYLIKLKAFYRAVIGHK